MYHVLIDLLTIAEWVVFKVLTSSFICRRKYRRSIGCRFDSFWASYCRLVSSHRLVWNR